MSFSSLLKMEHESRVYSLYVYVRRVLVRSFRSHFWIQWQTVLVENGFSKFSQANVTVLFVETLWFHCRCCLWVTCLYQWFLSKVLHCDIFPDSLKLHWNIYWHLFIILWPSVAQHVEPFSSVFARKDQASDGGSFYTQTLACHQFLSEQWNLSFFASVQTFFWVCFWHQIFLNLFIFSKLVSEVSDNNLFWLMSNK